MNQDTLWLQVPAKQTLPLNLAGASHVADKLENIAIKLASLQDNTTYYLDKINVILFAADHGITSDVGNSLAQPITKALLKKFSHSGDIHHVMENKLSTKLEVINLGTKTDLTSSDSIIHSVIARSTANFCCSPAMNNQQLARAINIGRQSVQRIHISGTRLFVAGEINQTNNISALAMTYALLNIAPEKLTVYDAAYNEKQNKEKNKLIRIALEQHKDKLSSPLEILQHLGSFEIAALTGAYLCCAHIGIPVLIDSFSNAVAALITTRLCPGAEQCFLYSRTSSNPAHNLILKSLKAEPLLQLNKNIDGMAGITNALSLLHLACARHNKNITFT